MNPHTPMLDVKKLSLPAASIALSLIIVALGVALYIWNGSGSGMDVRKFTGYLTRVSDNDVTLNGVFYDPEGKLPQNLASRREFQFWVDENTVFWRTLVKKPSFDELPSGMYFIDDLPKEEGAGRLQDLAVSMDLGSVYVEAEFPSSILAAQGPVAASVLYRITVEPSPPPSAE